MRFLAWFTTATFVLVSFGFVPRLAQAAPTSDTTRTRVAQARKRPKPPTKRTKRRVRTRSNAVTMNARTYQSRTVLADAFLWSGIGLVTFGSIGLGVGSSLMNAELQKEQLPGQKPDNTGINLVVTGSIIAPLGFILVGVGLLLRPSFQKVQLTRRPKPSTTRFAHAPPSPSPSPAPLFSDSF